MRVVVFALTLALAPAPGVAGNSPSQFSRRRLDQAVRESARAEPSFVSASWARVGRLRRGLALVLEADGAGEQTLYFVRADAGGLVGLDLSGLPTRTVRTSLDVLADWPEVFDETSLSEFRRGNLRASATGIFVEDVQVVDLQSRSVYVPRAAVAKLSVASESIGSRRAAGGLLMLTGMLINGIVGYVRCGCAEGSFTFVGSALFWGGALTALTAPGAPKPGPSGRTVIYQRPDSASLE